MSIEWADYVIYDPGFSSLLGDLSKGAARTAFRELMGAKDERISQVTKLLRTNGVRAETDDAGLDEMSRWFRDNVEGERESGRLVSRWYSVVNDLALLLGDEVIRRAPNLRWEMYDRGRRDLSFQRHVLVGFTGVANPGYRVDIDLLLATHAHRVVAGIEGDLTPFRTWVQAAVEKS